MIRYVLMASIVIVVAYAIYEIRLWSLRPDYVSLRQRRIRSLGLFFLLTALVLWIRATYVPVPVVHHTHITRAAQAAAVRWLTYYMLPFLAFLPLIPLALLDARENLKRASDERRKIRMEALAALDSIPDADKDPQDTSAPAD